MAVSTLTMAIYANAILLHTILSGEIWIRASLFQYPLALDAETYEHVISYSAWSQNCTSVSVPGTYPQAIPAQTRVPHWAYLDPTGVRSACYPLFLLNRFSLRCSPIPGMYHWRKVRRCVLCQRTTSFMCCTYRLYHRFARSYRQRFQCPKLDYQPLTFTPGQLRLLVVQE
ncbi:hypothetical protein BGY98DRAFT_989448 [Russula aff. rugulosa BPL654]|nr:hypothetical protein BGY98DRAFT_989448 [Russula aff. rugulosa BPL654]